MLILGINDAHDASACLIKDGVLLAAAAEERFRRVKMIASYPEKAIEYVLKFSGYSSSDLDHLAVVSKKGLSKTTKLINKIDNAYWGPNLDDKEILKFKLHPFIKKNFIQIKDKHFEKTSAILAKGEILFFCYGRMEFGQRVLGHRSILCDPSKFESINKINTTIKKRDFWMPFTPSILKKFAKKYVINPKNILSSFMTTCYDTTEIGKEHLKAAIHPYDFTVRPQIVTKKTCLAYYTLIEKFYKKTGIGGLLNTSLNIHDKLIVCQPFDIINEILKKNSKAINYIYVQDTLYKRKI